MTIKPTFTNGKSRHGGPNIVSSQIPPTELNRIRQTRSSAETIVALLNEAESLYSWRQKNALMWSECPHCQTIFVQYRRDTRRYCSRECNGHYRGQEWAKHAHKGRAAWTAESEASYLEKMSGANNPAWKGGLTYFKRKGSYANQSIKYVQCPLEFATMARKDGYVMEHRLLVAMELGRPLLRSEVVHHANHDATDNRIENLILFASNADHKRHEHGQAIEPLWQPSLRSSTPD
jgi:endogenous inhibitor of DNA gyrase (YacG/DUF329 family)